MEPQHLQPLQIRVNLRIMSMKGYSTLIRSSNCSLTIRCSLEHSFFFAGGTFFAQIKIQSAYFKFHWRGGGQRVRLNNYREIFKSVIILSSIFDWLINSYGKKQIIFCSTYKTQHGQFFLKVFSGLFVYKTQ